MKLVSFTLFFILSFSSFFLKTQANDVNNVVYSGARSSHYGIRPFPSPEEWKSAISKMNNYFPQSTPCAIWIVGTMRGHEDCFLGFPPPNDSIQIPHVYFAEKDHHESYLSYFDTTGIKVFLQVESALANNSQLIQLVLDRYKHHSCVVGYGIDVEWYRESEKKEWGMPVADDSAEIWEKEVKSYNPDYKLFFKHWDRKWMPPKYRGDLIFVDDSQQFKSYEEMISEFTDYWAKHFYPNQVWFQIGYPSDSPIWKQFSNPPEKLGTDMAKGTKQECGIFWVDFSLKPILLKETKSNEK